MRALSDAGESDYEDEPKKKKAAPKRAPKTAAAKPAAAKPAAAVKVPGEKKMLGQKRFFFVAPVSRNHSCI